MSHLLELLGKGLGAGLEETLGRYFWAGGGVSVSELSAHAAEHPSHPDIQCQLGLAYLRAARLGEAVEHLGLACKYKPDYLAPRLALASALEERGDQQKALDQLKVANQIQVGHPAVLFCIGYLLEKMGNSEEAAEYYRQALKTQPDLLAARHRLAAVAVFLDNLPEAITQYEFLVKADPGDNSVRITLAQLCHRAKSHAAAIEHYETAIAMEPENWALVDDQVEALVADGQYREAIERLHELLGVQGAFPDLHVRLADLYSHIGDDEQAMSHYQTALELQPRYLEANVKVGTHHLINGRWDEASEAFTHAAELNDELLTAYVGLGVAQAAGGDKSAAMNSFDLASAVEPNSTLLVREMARLQLKSALETQARQHADEPLAGEEPGGGTLHSDDLLKLQMERHAEELSRHPGHADLRYRYGVLLRAEGNMAEAMEQFEAAIELNPSYTQAIIKRGMTLQDMGRSEDAIEAYKAALDIEPKYVDLHYRLGLLYTDGKRFEEAVRHMEAADKHANGNVQIRANLALSLQNMGLMDRAAATWRSLARMHKVGAQAEQG